MKPIDIADTFPSAYLKLTFWTIITGGGIVPQSGKQNAKFWKQNTEIKIHLLNKQISNHVHTEQKQSGYQLIDKV